MPKPPVSIKVTTADTELQFAVDKQSSTQALFDQVITTTGIKEVRINIPFYMLYGTIHLRRPPFIFRNCRLHSV
jgi:hypothetical protein